MCDTPGHTYQVATLCACNTGIRHITTPSKTSVLSYTHTHRSVITTAAACKIFNTPHDVPPNRFLFYYCCKRRQIVACQRNPLLLSNYAVHLHPVCPVHIIYEVIRISYNMRDYVPSRRVTTARTKCPAQRSSRAVRFPRSVRQTLPRKGMQSTTTVSPWNGWDRAKPVFLWLQTNRHILTCCAL